MNRNEAKAYALNELGLDREYVRQFGNLSRTQTWLDAIAAQVSGGIAICEAVIVEDAIAAQASGGIAPTPSEVIAEEAVIVEDAIAPESAIAPSAAVIVEEMPGIALVPSEVIVEDAIALQTGIALELATPAPSFETFWDSAPALLQPQPLINISVLDRDWDAPEPPASPASEVIVYPVVIGLVMLWAMVQLLLLGGKALCGLLTGLADRLDLLAQERLQRQREVALQPASALVLALP